MTEDNQNEIIDLDFNMEDVDIERPVLKETVADLQVVSTQQVQTSKGNKMLKVQYKTASSLETTKGKTVGAGMVLFDQMMLEDVGAMQAGSWREKVAKLHLAITGDKSGKPNTGQWINKIVKAKIKVRPERTDEKSGQTYPESNEISFYYPPTAV